MSTTVATMHPQYQYVATLTSPFAHGAGSSGNTRLLRTHEVVQPDDTTIQVPFLSGASIRHGIRNALAWRIASTCCEPGTMTKAQVDLLWSGGAISSTGAQVDLELQRRVSELLPALSVLGYAAHSDIHEGTARVSDAILVCAENAFRLPSDVAQARPRRAGAYRGEEFGTRHDTASTQQARMIAQPDTLDGGSISSTQMIFDTQVLLAGSQLYGTISLTPAATEEQRASILAGIGLWAHDGVAYLGASTNTGYGAALIDWRGTLDAAEVDSAIGALDTHLHGHSSDIRELLAEVAR
ncbi:MAG: hypothetical protein E7J54_31625 [Pseudomonas aeruginosa]|jgi:hypothetical protein|uniref:hypothetical protein n=1 Tax=Cutibacterium avidum TaxID=33010 RepID=UPI00291301F3|nr:hypothetical protein [Pseudomonas aeruginosa]